ncbi:MAG: phosphoglycerate mutase family protein, partial [Candidatus Heimdallarchaeota archaeon]
MKIILIRHGESEANRQRIIQGNQDFPTPELGMRQAAEMGHFFLQNGYSFDSVYSSDL